MKTLLQSLFLTIFLVKSLSQDLVIELFRHGARSPSGHIDPSWTDHDELTPVGMRQHFILGTLLAERYPHLLNAYDPNKIYVRSTNYNRTIMSAYSQLQGIFQGKGPTLPEDADKDLMLPPYSNTDLINSIVESLDDVTTAYPNAYQPVPIHSVDLNTDALLYSGPSNCPACAQWFKERPTDENSTKIFNTLNSTTSQLNSLGYNITQLGDYFSLADTVLANTFSNKTLPKGFELNSQIYNDTIFVYRWFTYYVYGGTGQELQAFSYTLVNQILTYLNATITNTMPTNFIMLSAHDTTLVRLLGIFNITTPDCLAANHQSGKFGSDAPYPQCIYPGYASNIFLELYNTTTDPYIKFFYNSDLIDVCQNGKGTCTFKDFSALANERVGLNATGYATICAIPNPDPNPDKPGDDTLEIVLIVIAAILGLSLIGAIAYFIRKRKMAKERLGSGFYREQDAEANPAENESH